MSVSYSKNRRGRGRTIKIVHGFNNGYAVTEASSTGSGSLLADDASHEEAIRAMAKALLTYAMRGDDVQIEINGGVA